MKKILAILFVVVSSLPASGQKQVADQLGRELEENKIRFPGMKPFLFFSQQRYAPGDTAFFRLFILAENERILPDRSIFTLALYNQEGSKVLQQRVPSGKAGVANQFILPETLTPGKYTLQVFTDSMTDQYGQVHELIISGDRRLTRSLAAGSDLKVYAEGGHVVPGFINKLVIRTLNKVESCELLSGEGKVSSIHFNTRGYASVQFLPKAGEVYWIEYEATGDKRKVMVPASGEREMMLRVYPGPRQSRIIDIAGPKSLDQITETKELPTTLRKENLFLVLIAQGEIIYSQEIRLNEVGRKQIIGSSDFFPSGFSELYLVDGDRRILAYRPMYGRHNDLHQLEIDQVPAAVGLRQDVEALLRVTDAAGQAVSGSIAVSVSYEESPSAPLLTPDPSLILQPGKLPIELSGTDQEIDLELLTIGAPKEIVPGGRHLLNAPNLTLGGRVHRADSAAALPDSSTVLVYLHKDRIQYETLIDKTGRFQFSKIYDFLGSDLVFFKVLHKGKDLFGARVEWITDTEMKIPATETIFEEGVLQDEYGIIRKQKRGIDQSYSFFQNPPSGLAAPINYNAELENEFKEADITIVPSEYTPFDTMQELILEVIPSVEFRRRQGDIVVRVALTSRSIFVPQRYAEGNPLYIIDGLMTSNTGYLMKLLPREIVSFKIINDVGKLNRLLNLGRNGVLFIQTVNPERTRKDLTKDLLVLQGMSPTILFSQKYPMGERVPDLRTLLYWSPLIRTDNSGIARFKFRTSDIPGSYTIRVMASLDNGHLITAERSFMVKFTK
ncbi:MAG: hypothetical protein SH819_13880 [Cytophagales bacterium]|nr:hypothetical protein [Cytophagales bacterium]